VKGPWGGSISTLPDIAGDDEGCPDLEPPDGLSADTPDPGIGEDTARGERWKGGGGGKERVRRGQHERRRPRHKENETLKHSSIFLDYPASLLMPAENLPLKGPRNSRRNHGPEAKSPYSWRLSHASPKTAELLAKRFCRRLYVFMPM